MNNETNKNKFSYELGHIYGAKISKSRKWLNLIITADHGNETLRITCPLPIIEDEDEPTNGKPYAALEKACNSQGVHRVEKAILWSIPVYEETKKPAEEPKADDLPF